jgi:hypothetical protein
VSWFWLNIPLATLFFLAWTLIPLWLVLKHPEPGPRAPHGGSALAEPTPTQRRAFDLIGAAIPAHPEYDVDTTNQARPQTRSSTPISLPRQT